MSSVQSINSAAENLLDIVDMSAIQAVDVLPIGLIALMMLLTAVLSLVYYRSIHSQTGRLKKLKKHVNNQSITARAAAHKIADITQLDNDPQLKPLRFAKAEPSKKQIVDFINQVLR